MSVKFYENALTALKKANTARKMVLAGRAGYDTVEQYQNFLESMVSPSSGMTQAPGPSIIDALKESKKPVVYVVDVIDCSQSMAGGKIQSALSGINEGIASLKLEDKVDYKYLLCDFSGRRDVNFSEVQPIKEVGKVSFDYRGMTALNDAIIETIDEVNRVRKNGEKVLINIYTDGDENNSANSKSRVEQVVGAASTDGFTITFIGTEADTKRVVRDYKIHETNTLAYDGSASGLTRSMNANALSRVDFADKLSKGQDVSKGFFKTVKK